MQHADEDRETQVRWQRESVLRARAEMLAARSALVEARQGLVESVGDWMCGSGALPADRDIAMLERLADLSARADAAYSRAISFYVACMGDSARLPR